MADLQLSLNTAWLMICAALIFFMQAGFAMLESGLVRSKNSVNVIMKNYIDMAFGAIAFWVVGFGLMFGNNPSGWFGTNNFMPSNLGTWDYSFLLFQMMFAATAATIVSGALAERIRYWPYIICAVIISAFIYPVFGSWAWGSFFGDTEGWLRRLGYIDFAGSGVVHAIGGWCALAGVIVLGPRTGRYGTERRAAHTKLGEKIDNRNIPGHNLIIVALGAFILWFGFFGFNGGSTLEASSHLGLILLNTHLAGAGGVLGTILVLLMAGRPILMTMTVNGGLAGMVAICASANAVEPGFAIVIGLIAGGLVVGGISLLDSLKLDDAVGAVSVHAFSGTWGILAVALFSKDNMFNWEQLGIQAIGAGTAFLWAFFIAFIMFTLVGFITNLRVSTTEERRGLDYSEHYEIGYPEFQRDLLHKSKE